MKAKQTELRGLAAASPQTRSRVARMGGDARSRNKAGLREAGKKGGESVKAEYGIEFYQVIGEKGGEFVKRRYGIGFYHKIGEKGGLSAKKKYGPKFYSQIGKKGGETVRQERGMDYYAALGRISGNKRKGYKIL
jgi:uncharacterized protein